ncbi:Fumarylacetoacetase [Terfezia boudieri ATCC MYA-4762]|uniref:Fumarylacetoacetase n=1 Tax=Terfezia boudieri ATCC MYA-4762 TaxID=1051890 RepID=A0A3N4L9N8_9PEZI|nr:Fumarylacetoacetase [Terfezia boudieri ATCC MYA-4762]
MSSSIAVLSPEQHLAEYSVRQIPLPLPADTDFSLSNIPFGVFTPPHLLNDRHICTAIGAYILDLHALNKHGAFSAVIPSTPPHELALKDPPVPHVLIPPLKYPHPLLSTTLNSLATLERSRVCALRKHIRELVEEGGIVSGPDTRPEWPLGTVFSRCLRDKEGHPLLKMHMPFHVGDYTDFYAGVHHAYNVGCLFRGRENALQPSYLHLPVGYHGRASTVCASGTPVRRPNGQLPPLPGGKPRFGPTEKMDYELELAAFVGVPNHGAPIPVDQAIGHIFGFVLMNDWSARDVQAWEYVPLGPFLGKSFATSISPWVVTVDALEPFRVEKEDQGVSLLPYLTEKNSKTVYDFTLEVEINPGRSPGELSNTIAPIQSISTTSPRYLIWSFEQMLAHHTINGCKLLSGDLLGSGTISGPQKGQEGSLLEMSKNGTEDADIGGGQKRRWLEDGDEVVIKGWGITEGGERVGFGDCRGRILAALELKP